MFVFYDVLFPDCKLPLNMDTYLFCIARVYPRLGLDELSFVNPPFVFVVLCKWVKKEKKNCQTNTIFFKYKQKSPRASVLQYN